MRLAIAGAGLAGLSCVQNRTDRDLMRIVLESRVAPGSEVAPRKNSNSDCYEELYILLSTHPSLFKLFAKLGISGWLQKATFRSVQKLPVADFVLDADFNKQPTLASMEGAVFSGKLCARAIAETYPARSTAVHA